MYSFEVVKGIKNGGVAVGFADGLEALWRGR